MKQHLVYFEQLPQQFPFSILLRLILRFVDMLILHSFVICVYMDLTPKRSTDMKGHINAD